jgi:Fic family protein
VTDARETGLARLGLAAPVDARAAASVLAATLIAPSAGIAAVHEAIDPGGDPAAVELPDESQSMLVPVALGHGWLAASRPFFLGNARTARAVLSAQLGGPVLPFPVSGGLLADEPVYRAAVEAYAGGDANPIVLVVAGAVQAGIENARDLATALAITRDDWDARMTGVRSHASARDLVAFALEEPVLDAKVTVPALGVTLAAAYTSIETLVDRGILVARGPERRNRAWFAPAVLDAVDAFVARAR